MGKALLAAIALLVILWGWLSAFSYLDPVRLCRMPEGDGLDDRTEAVHGATR